MNVDKMTERVREALNDAFGRALRERNSGVEVEHVLAALLDQDQGVVPALLTKAVLPYMKRAGGGSIVFQGSISAFLAQPNCAT